MQLSHCGSSHIAPPSYVPPHLRVPFSSWIRGSFIPHRQGTEAISPISVSGHVTRPTLPQTELSSLGQPSEFTREGIRCSYSVCVCMTAASHRNIEKIHSRRYWHYQNICDYNSAYKLYPCIHTVTQMLQSWKSTYHVFQWPLWQRISAR